LIAQLQFSDDDREEGRFLGTWHELLQRTQCGFCQLVAATVSDNAESSDSDGIRPDHPISILIFPGEQSFRLSYPSRWGLRLAFVAEDARYARGPDTARLVHKAGIQISRIRSWLRTCDEKHEACSLETVEHELVRIRILANTYFNARTDMYLTGLWRKLGLTQL
jgi:hypothetical protein